jgi:spore coat protein E
VHANCIQHPSCVEASIDDQNDGVHITIEREFIAELIAETKLCVVVCPGDCADFDKQHELDEFDDHYDDELDEDMFVDEDETS